MIKTRRNLMRQRLLVILLLTLLITGCGDDGGPVAPSPPQFPQVAGTYNGTLTLTFSLVSDTLTGSMRMVVVQAGAQLTITGSMMLLGETVVLPAVTGTVNETGFFTATGGGFSRTVSDETCGTLTTTSSTLTFSGSTARIAETATTEFCGNIQLFWNPDKGLVRDRQRGTRADSDSDAPNGDGDIDHMEIPFKSASGEGMAVQSGDPRGDVRFIRAASDQRADETMFVLTNEEARKLVQYLGDWFAES